LFLSWILCLGLSFDGSVAATLDLFLAARDSAWFSSLLQPVCSSAWFGRHGHVHVNPSSFRSAVLCDFDSFIGLVLEPLDPRLMFSEFLTMLPWWFLDHARKMFHEMSMSL
jgi:hypothetical protein